MPGAVVFLGPSLSSDKALQILDAEYLPPAKRGDICDAARKGADVICLIDGVFFQECSVAHKEVLYALKHGVRVVGASSMGALRASELDIYGMEGVGEIYKAYKKGALVSDDEVALIFDPFTFEPLSEPLVNTRHNLRLALEKGIIDEPTKEAIFKAAESLYFPERSYDRILKLCEVTIPLAQLEGFRTFINKERRDLKMEDAIFALKRTKEILDEG
ncbi:MAG: TfuA-related McrA-glycine thioamidation protein [Methanotrichaceae archaeon]